jgi:hypothetical protein
MSKQMTDKEAQPPAAVPPPDPGTSPGKVDPELVDKLLADAEGTDLLGPDGLLAELTKNVLERALDAELTDQLGYELGDPAGRGSGNSRNGASGKTVHTDVGSVRLDVPRDRNGSFEPQIVPQGAIRLQGFNDRIIALYARGMTVRDIQAHLLEIYGVQVVPGPDLQGHRRGARGGPRVAAPAAGAGLRPRSTWTRSAARSATTGGS